MNFNTAFLAHVSDDQLLVRVKELIREERAATAHLLVHLAEMEERKLHCREGCSSLFSYCVEILHLSEPAAYRRIKAARLAKRFPVVLPMLAEGSIHLAALDLLAPLLTDANHVTVLAEARHKSKREVEELAARLRPLPDLPPLVRKLPRPGPVLGPASAPGQASVLGQTSVSGQESVFWQASVPGQASGPGSASVLKQASGSGLASVLGQASVPVQVGVALTETRFDRGHDSGGRPTAPDPVPEHRPAIAPLSPSRYRIQFTAGAETYRKLRQVQELLRHQVPDGDPATIVDKALTLLLTKLLRERTGAATRPRRRKRSAPESGDGRRGKPPAPESGDRRRAVPLAPRTGEERHETPAAEAGWEREGLEAPEAGKVREGRAAGEAQEARRKRVAAGKPTESRHIPAEVKRAVWRRDRGRCAFTAKDGRRCSSRGALEFHHIEPYMLGGRATIGNISLRCRAHNAYEGALIFGDRRVCIPETKPQELSPGRVPESRPPESFSGRVEVAGGRRTGDSASVGLGDP